MGRINEINRRDFLRLALLGGTAGLSLACLGPNWTGLGKGSPVADWLTLQPPGPGESSPDGESDPAKTECPYTRCFNPIPLPEDYLRREAEVLTEMDAYQERYLAERTPEEQAEDNALATMFPSFIETVNIPLVFPEALDMTDSRLTGSWTQLPSDENERVYSYENLKLAIFYNYDLSHPDYMAKIPDRTKAPVTVIVYKDQWEIQLFNIRHVLDTDDQVEVFQRISVNGKIAHTKWRYSIGNRAINLRMPVIPVSPVFRLKPGDPGSLEWQVINNIAPQQPIQETSFKTIKITPVG